MAKTRRKWSADFTFAIHGYPAARFNGREPFQPSSQAQKDALIELGVFKELPNGMVAYCGAASVRLNGKRYIEVDGDGFIEYDTAELSVDDAKIISAESAKEE